MGIDTNITFVPLSNLTEVDSPKLLQAQDPLGPVGQLRGSWKGTGFNTIWRPLHDPANPGQTHFLELNLTVESIDFTAIDGPIPNRGLLQNDLFMYGLTYLQQVSDNFGNGLHIEPGLWLNIPATTDPSEPPTVARLGSVPHGTSILAQGEASSEARAPGFAKVSINPFPIGDPSGAAPMPESNLSIPTPFRSPPELIAGITQAMVDDPNIVLSSALEGQNIVNTINLIISTDSTPPPGGSFDAPIYGGGTANTAFLQGSVDGPNADAVQMSAIFWIETVEHADGSQSLQLQYLQIVNLNFAGKTWPHVSVATLQQVS
jgi:hypothetical protein